MFPRPSYPLHHLSIRLASNFLTPTFKRSVSLGLFREKKNPITEKSAVPSIHHTGTSGAFYPPLKLHSAISARAKRDKRRLPIFPDGRQWTGIRGGTAGDDAWVMGKYYLGKPPLFLVGIQLLIVGIADGVGAWNTKEKGRPHLWSRLLMHYWALECEERMKLWKADRQTGIASGQFNQEEEIDVISMLHRAYLRTAIETEKSGGWIGSTTACVALLQQSALHIANVPPTPFEFDF
jgi:serine/threonine protein phosphatase PrpC